jgi:hypothetical protein
MNEECPVGTNWFLFCFIRRARQRRDFSVVAKLVRAKSMQAFYI